MDKKYFIVTYGCQMNVHESEKIAGILQGRGYRESLQEQDADIIVFNTCCIRENAENHAYGNIGALKKLKKTGLSYRSSPSLIKEPTGSFLFSFTHIPISRNAYD